jgi:hypothetical protein
MSGIFNWAGQLSSNELNATHASQVPIEAKKDASVDLTAFTTFLPLRLEPGAYHRGAYSLGPRR